jgi:hypothetical protein
MNTKSRSFVIIVMKNTFWGTNIRNKSVLWPFLRISFVGMFYRKSVLVIDGKNNNDNGKQENHKLRRRSEQYARYQSSEGKA